MVDEMLCCHDCGEIFRPSEGFEERQNCIAGHYETYLVCPRCRSADIWDALQCESCEEWFVGLTDVLDGDYAVCAECYKDAQRIAADLKEKHGDALAAAVASVIMEE